MEGQAFNKVYFDYAATTPVDPRVVKAMQPYFVKIYGNASSLNSFGVEAKRALEDSRRTIAEFMNADPDEVVFTGSATEANNLALKGHAYERGKEKCHIAVSSIEHDCILNSARWLEKKGFNVSYLPVDRYGLVKMDAIERVLEKGATLVSVIHGNNEIGTVQPIERIAQKCHEYDAIFHTDAVQSFGKLPLNVKEMSIDLMTINAHKLYGPKGVGALYIASGVRIEPLLHGGGHEFGLRSGTENVPGIVGFAKTVELRKEEMAPEAKRLTSFRDRLIEGSLEIEAAYLNGHPTKRLPNNVSLRFSYIEGEAVVLCLDTKGIAASSGSACSTASERPSHVLLAIGLKTEEARGNLRLSLGKYNTREDVEYTLQVLPGIIGKLRAMSPITPAK